MNDNVIRDLATAIFGRYLCINRLKRPSSHVPPRFHPDLVHQLRQCLGRCQSSAGSARARATFTTSISKQRWWRPESVKKKYRHVCVCICICVCVCVTRTESTAREQWEQAGRGTERERDGPNERDRNRTMEAHTETKGMFTLVVETFLYPSRFLRSPITPDTSLPLIQRSNVEPQNHVLRDLTTRSQMRAARTRRGCHHVERTFALGRPELGFTTTVWIRFFPSARESKRRYHDDACAPPPIHPFPPGHFHSALARSLSARRHGALHEQSRSSSHIIPETPENPHDFRPILAPPPYSPFPDFLGSFFSSHFPFFLEFHRWPGTLVGCRRARHVLWQCRSTGLFRHSTPKREVARLSRFQSQNCFVSQLRHTSLLAYYLIFLVDDVETMSRVIQLGYFWKFSNIYNEQINIRERKEK